MGVLRYEFYSKLLGKQIRLCMVLPEQAHAGKLPDATLYLLHGGGGNAEDWLRYTSVERYAGSSGGEHEDEGTKSRKQRTNVCGH